MEKFFKTDCSEDQTIRFFRVFGWTFIAGIAPDGDIKVSLQKGDNSYEMADKFMAGLLDQWAKSASDEALNRSIGRFKIQIETVLDAMKAGQISVARARSLELCYEAPLLAAQRELADRQYITATWGTI